MREEIGGVGGGVVLRLAREKSLGGTGGRERDDDLEATVEREALGVVILVLFALFLLGIDGFRV